MNPKQDNPNRLISHYGDVCLQNIEKLRQVLDEFEIKVKVEANTRADRDFVMHFVSNLFVASSARDGLLYQAKIERK